MKNFILLFLSCFLALPASAQRFVKIAADTNALVSQPAPDVHSVTLIKGYASSNENLSLHFQYFRDSVTPPDGVSVFQPTFGQGIGRYHLMTLQTVQQTNVTIISTNTVLISSNLTFIATNITLVTSNLTFVTTNSTNYAWTFINQSETNVVFTTNLYFLTPTNLNAQADNVAELVNLPISIPYATLGGWTLRGDGGGGDFVLTNSVVSTNMGTRIASSTTGYSWDRLYSGKANVLWFGANTNGVETRGPIQNALTNGFSEVYFPRGDYAISGILTPTSHQTLSGDGDASTIRQTAALSSTIVGTNLTGVTIRDLRLVGLGDDSLGQAPSLQSGIFLALSTNVTVTAVTFTNHSISGITFQSVTDSLVEGNRFDRAGWPSGIDPFTTTANYQLSDIRLNGDSQRNLITANHSESGANFGIQLATEPSAGGTVSDNVVSHNTIKGALKYGVILYINSGGHVTRNLISENVISDMRGVAGNGGTWDQTAGIYIASAEDNSIIGNILNNIALYSTGTTVPPGGISINGPGAVLIADNRLTNIYARGITVQGTFGVGANETNGYAVIARNSVVNTGRVRTTGNITNGLATLTVASTNGFIVGNTVLVYGAGVAGANLSTIILSFSGNVLTLNTAASTTVTGGAVEKVVPWEGGIVVLNRKRVRVTGNVLHNNYDAGVYANGSTEFLAFNDNSISSPQKFGILVSGSVTNSQFNRNVIMVTNDLYGGIWLANTNHISQIMGNTIFAASQNTAIVTGIGDTLVSQNTIHGGLTGVSSVTTNEFQNIFSGVTNNYSGASRTSLLRPLHIHSSLYVDGGATNNKLLVQGAFPQLAVSPESESSYGVMQLANLIGTRKLELLYVGSNAAGAYGAAPGHVALNASGGAISFALNDVLRWTMTNQTFKSSNNGTIETDTGRLTLASLGGNGDVFITPHGTGSVQTASIRVMSGGFIRSSSGTPEGVVTAPIGSLFLRTDGGALTTLYVKESGTGNTGWVGAGSGGGSVSSVGLTMPSVFSVAGSPVTGSGTLAVTGSDPGADKLVGWDDTGNVLQYMNIGVGLVYDAATDTLSSTNVGVGGGDFVGPASSTDNAILRFDGTTGKLGQNSIAILSDSGVLTGLIAARVSGKITNDFLTASALMASDTDKSFKSVLIGSGLTYNGTTLAASGGGGSVTSVGMTVPAPFSVAGSPIVGSGTLAVTATDPAGDRILGWDDTGNLLQYMIIGAGLTYNPATDTLAATGGGTSFPFGDSGWVQLSDGAGAFTADNGLTYTNITRATLQLGTAAIPGVLNLGNQYALHSYSGGGTPYSSVFLGPSAGNFTSTSASFNTAIGGSAMVALTDGSFNTGVGYGSLTSVTTGQRNSALGYGAGDGINVGGDNVLLGYAADTSAAGSTNQIVIGSFANGIGNNTATVGGVGALGVVLNVNAGQSAGTRAKVGGTIHGNTADDNTSPYMPYTLPGNTLAVALDRLIIRGAGLLAANGNAKSIALKFGGTTMATISTSASAASWSYVAEVMYSAPGNSEFHITYGSSDTFQKTAFGTASATFTGDITIENTGNDATQHMLSIEWHPAP